MFGSSKQTEKLSKLERYIYVAQGQSGSMDRLNQHAVFKSLFSLFQNLNIKNLKTHVLQHGSYELLDVYEGKACGDICCQITASA